MEEILKLFQGNNVILILLAVLLFKDQILAFLKPKPADPAPPPPVTTPPPVVVPPPPGTPLLDIIKELLPILLPLITNLIKEQVKTQDQAK